MFNLLARGKQLSSLLDIIPRTCPLCSARITQQENLICDLCLQALPWNNNQTSTAVTPLISAFTYASPIKQLILQGKSSKHLAKIQLLAELLRAHFPNRIEERPEAILPVPLHYQRLRERGFNQALELVRPLAKDLGLPLLIKEVIRQRYTDEQKKLAATERQHNLAQAFQLISPIHYKHIAIFDDVVTTGATCAELEALLIDQGVEKVQIWCCAQTKMT
ncbi:MAG: ComF family protein [Thiothrix sp.]|nr:MAG: ComF family protein [Thiothrix sp.]